MTVATVPVSSFDVLAGPSPDHLLNAAAAATTSAVEDPTHGVLVVVLRPTQFDHQVIDGGGTGVLRAAVSVAVGAGNDRLWRDAPTDSTAEFPTRSLPEVVASAADAAGVRAAHIGVARRTIDDTEVVDAVAIWFETWNGVARLDDRRTVLGMLAAAGVAEAERRAELERSAPTLEVVPEPDTGRTFDPNDPSLDPVTGLLNEAAFDDRLLDFEGDEATVIVVDLDHFDHIAATVGDAGIDAIAKAVADRLVETCNHDGSIGRLGRDRFAVMLTDADRSAVMQTAKRIIAAIAEPMRDDVGCESVTATVALAHQSGLVDPEELMESAVDAVASGKRSGSGRLVLAA